MMGSVFTCWCFRFRVLVLGGGSVAFSLINGINLWRQVSSFRNSTLDDHVWSLKLCVHFLVIEAWWGFFPPICLCCGNGIEELSELKHFS
jgi:hypothetical protein